MAEEEGGCYLDLGCVRASQSVWGLLNWWRPSLFRWLIFECVWGTKGGPRKTRKLLIISNFSVPSAAWVHPHLCCKSLLACVLVLRLICWWAVRRPSITKSMRKKAGWWDDMWRVTYRDTLSICVIQVLKEAKEWAIWRSRGGGSMLEVPQVGNTFGKLREWKKRPYRPW